jgi:hypothetical protein
VTTGTSGGAGILHPALDDVHIVYAAVELDGELGITLPEAHVPPEEFSAALPAAA